jgi:hypothetical protein
MQPNRSLSIGEVSKNGNKTLKRKQLKYPGKEASFFFLKRFYF